MVSFDKNSRPVIATVCAIILGPEPTGEKVLLTRRGYPPFQGKWCLPGGHIDPYETSQAAIIREVKEEVGLDFEPQFSGYFDEIMPEHEIHALVMIYSGKAAGKLQAQPGEVTEMGWFSFQKAQALPLAFQHNQILQGFSNGSQGIFILQNTE